MKVVITGGHHTSALPVIEELKNKCSDIEIFWFGHKFSAYGDKNPTLEFREITSLGIPFYHIHAGKFYRTYNLKRLAKVPFGFFQCLYLLVKIKPDVVLSFGGYIAVPAVLAASILRIPSLTHEQTATAGWGNVFASRFVKKVLISWQESAKYFPKSKIVLTGLPLRRQVFEIKSNNFIFSNNLPVVYITTGKTGSHIINKVVEDSLWELLDFCNVIHQTGDNSVYKDFDRLESFYAQIKDKVKGIYYPRKFIFIDEIGEVYSKSSLVVGRSGAHTVAELLNLKKRCILIPIPWASHNEQYENAKVLQNMGLAKILPEDSLTSSNLVSEIKQALSLVGVVNDNVKLNENEILKPAHIIASEVLSLAKRNEK